jgi:hypothetical protein
LKGKEFYRTIGFKEIAMIYGDTEKSYRKTVKLINRIRYQEQGGTPNRTLQENTEKEGRRLIDYIEEKSKRILKNNGFNEEGECLSPPVAFAHTEAVTLADEMISQAAQKANLGDIAENPVPYEDPDHTVNISIDDVNVKKQKDVRKGCEDDEELKRKYVHNTIAHIAKGNKNYTLNGDGIKKVLCYLIAFIFNNGLSGCRLQFFTDGHPILNETIVKIFIWFKNTGIILDWFHLEKKCKEQLSLAMKGRDLRNQTLDLLMPLLWNGETDRAIDQLKGLGSRSIKSKAAIEKLTNYLERNKSYIPCYGVRKALGLRVSSNTGEKMNDIIVSDRQKHNGMSWSKPGSVALASISSLKRNKEDKRWFEKGDLHFKLVA